MTKRKKPTLNEIKTVVENTLRHMSFLQQRVDHLDKILGNYFKYKNDEKDFGKWIQDQIKKEGEKDGSTVRSSNKGNKETK